MTKRLSGVQDKRSKKPSRGWIYILSNPGLCYMKVGFTTNMPKDRAATFTRREKAKKPYGLEYAGYVRRCQKVEKEIHEILADCHVEREFFDCTVEEFKKALHWNFSAIPQISVLRRLLEGRRCLK